MDPIIRREIILDHYQNPRHKGLISSEEYQNIRTNNESCIDDLMIQIKVEDGLIKDIRFDGEACAISTSASSIMASMFMNKTRVDATKLLNEYEKMLNEESYDSKTLGELNVYDEIYKQPNRKKCAILPFRAIHEILNNDDLWKESGDKSGNKRP